MKQVSFITGESPLNEQGLCRNLGKEMKLRWENRSPNRSVRTETGLEMTVVLIDSDIGTYLS